MPRVAATLVAVAALAALAVPAAAAPVDVDAYRGADGIGFSLTAAVPLTADGLAPFSFVAAPPAGDQGPYTADPTIDAPAVGLARRRSLVAGTAIGCGPPAVTAVYGTVGAAARIVVATTTTGRRYRMHRVDAPSEWGYGWRVYGRVLAGAHSITKVEAFARKGKRFARAVFGSPPACPTA